MTAPAPICGSAGKQMGEKRNDGARASAALVHLHQGPRPLDPFRRYCKFGRKDYFRQFRWGYGKFVGFWPKKARENPRGRASFPPGIFPCFHRMLCIRDGVSFRRLNRRKSAQRTLLVSPDLTADDHNVIKPGILPINSGRLFSHPTKQHPPMRVQGDHPPGQVWAESPASPLFSNHFPLFFSCSFFHALIWARRSRNLYSRPWSVGW